MQYALVLCNEDGTPEEVFEDVFDSAESAAEKAKELLAGPDDPGYPIYVAPLVMKLSVEAVETRIKEEKLT